MKIKEKMNNLKWFIENKGAIEKMLNDFNKNKNKKSNDAGYSLAGVPDFQREYVNEILQKEK